MQVYMRAQDPPTDFAIVVRTTTDPRRWCTSGGRPRHQSRPRRVLDTNDDARWQRQSRGSGWRERAGGLRGRGADLASLGLYGLVAHSVTGGRTKSASGWPGGGARDVLSLVVRHGLSMALLGTVLGLAGAAALSRSLEGLLSRSTRWISRLAPCAPFCWWWRRWRCVPAIRATNRSRPHSGRLDYPESEVRLNASGAQSEPANWRAATRVRERRAANEQGNGKRASAREPRVGSGAPSSARARQRRSVGARASPRAAPLP